MDQYLPRLGGQPVGDPTLSLTLYGGGETIEDVREIREDQTLRQTLDLPTLPSSSAIGDRLKRMGCRGGLQGMAQVNTAIAQRVLTHEDRTAYTLLVDPTIIAAEMTYLGVKGDRPVLATLQELGLVIAYEFRADTDTGSKVEILQETFRRLSAGKAITTILLDAEYYTDAVMAYLTCQGVRWAGRQGCRGQNPASLPEQAWRPLRTRGGRDGS